MKISKIEIEHIAELSRLKLTDQEKEKFSGQLSAILEHMKLLNEVKTENIPATTNVTGLSNIMRKDEIVSDFKVDEDADKNREKLLKNAGEVENGAFKVPKIIE